MRKDAAAAPGRRAKGAGKQNRQAMMTILDDTRAKIRPLLTPEQQTTLDNWKPAARGKKAGGAGAAPPAATTNGGAFGGGN